MPESARYSFVSISHPITGYLNSLKRRGLMQSKNPYQFKHGASYKMPDGKILLASYHPSNQNTQTGKLTRPMFAKIFEEAQRLADA